MGQDLTEEQKNEALKDEPPVLQDWELSLEYGRYLKEVVEALESDPSFRKKLEEAEADDIKSGKIAKELHFVDHNIRSKLDELKRRELERLRHYAIKEHEKSNGIDRKRLKEPVHIDHRNPSRFDVEDLKKLIQQTTRDLEAVDQQRKDDFTRYEMQKQFDYQQKLAQMTFEERKKLEAEHESEIAKHKKHPKLHHPGSKQQLEEVWEEQDHLNRDDFDPNTFFHLHDLDGNGVWDESEVKALFLKELDKMYDPNAPEDDLVERQEEMERMREHIFKEADTNSDDLISLEEFIAQTHKNSYDHDEGWQSLDEQQIYTQEEYDRYQQQHIRELQRAGNTVYDLNGVPLPQYVPGGPPLYIDPYRYPGQQLPAQYLSPNADGHIPANALPIHGGHELVNAVPVQHGHVPVNAIPAQGGHVPVQGIQSPSYNLLPQQQIGYQAPYANTGSHFAVYEVPAAGSNLVEPASNSLPEYLEQQQGNQLANQQQYNQQLSSQQQLNQQKLSQQLIQQQVPIQQLNQQQVPQQQLNQQQVPQQQLNHQQVPQQQLNHQQVPQHQLNHQQVPQQQLNQQQAPQQQLNQQQAPQQLVNQQQIPQQQLNQQQIPQQQLNQQQIDQQHLNQQQISQQRLKQQQVVQ